MLTNTFGMGYNKEVGVMIVKKIIHKNVTHFIAKGWMPTLCKEDARLDKHITNNPDDVTCKKCLARMAGIGKKKPMEVTNE